MPSALPSSVSLPPFPVRLVKLVEADEDVVGAVADEGYGGIDGCDDILDVFIAGNIEIIGVGQDRIVALIGGFDDLGQMVPPTISMT